MSDSRKEQEYDGEGQILSLNADEHEEADQIFGSEDEDVEGEGETEAEEME